MHRAARLSAILARLANGGSVAVADLADDLDASPATIRRDLVILEQQRLLARTHGGAIAHAVSYELPLRYKGVRYADEKRRIARQAAAYVSEGMAVGLTGGTTATEVARAIADQQKLTIVTNALNIASELAVRPGLKLISTGGVVRSQSYELSGPIAEASLTGLNLNIAFIGVDGIDARAGCTTHQEVEAHTNAVMISVAACCRGRRQLQDRKDRVRPDLRGDSGERAHHRRGRRRRCGTGADRGGGQGHPGLKDPARAASRLPPAPRTCPAPLARGNPHRPRRHGLPVRDRRYGRAYVHIHS